MARGAGQVLHQAATQMNIQQLHPAANRQHRKVARHRFVDFYEPGSWGPDAIKELIAPHHWYLPDGKD